MSNSVKTAGNMPEDVIPVWDDVWGTVARKSDPKRERLLRFDGVASAVFG